MHQLDGLMEQHIKKRWKTTHHGDNEDDNLLWNQFLLHHVLVCQAVCSTLTKELQADKFTDTGVLVDLLPIACLELGPDKTSH